MEIAIDGKSHGSSETAWSEDHNVVVRPRGDSVPNLNLANLPAASGLGSYAEDFENSVSYGEDFETSYAEDFEQEENKAPPVAGGTEHGGTCERNLSHDLEIKAANNVSDTNSPQSVVEATSYAEDFEQEEPNESIVTGVAGHGGSDEHERMDEVDRNSLLEPLEAHSNVDDDVEQEENRLSGVSGTIEQYRTGSGDEAHEAQPIVTAADTYDTTTRDVVPVAADTESFDGGAFTNPVPQDETESCKNAIGSPSDVADEQEQASCPTVHVTAGLLLDFVHMAVSTATDNAAAALSPQTSPQRRIVMTVHEAGSDELVSASVKETSPRAEQEDVVLHPAGETLRNASSAESGYLSAKVTPRTGRDTAATETEFQAQAPPIGSDHLEPEPACTNDEEPKAGLEPTTTPRAEQIAEASESEAETAVLAHGQAPVATSTLTTARTPEDSVLPAESLQASVIEAERLPSAEDATVSPTGHDNVSSESALGLADDAEPVPVSAKVTSRSEQDEGRSAAPDTFDGDGEPARLSVKGTPRTGPGEVAPSETLSTSGDFEPVVVSDKVPLRRDESNGVLADETDHASASAVEGTTPRTVRNAVEPAPPEALAGCANPVAHPAQATPCSAREDATCATSTEATSAPTGSAEPASRPEKATPEHVVQDEVTVQSVAAAPRSVDESQPVSASRKVTPRTDGESVTAQDADLPESANATSAVLASEKIVSPRSETETVQRSTVRQDPLDTESDPTSELAGRSHPEPDVSNAEDATAAPESATDPAGPMVWDEDLNKLVPYAEYCATHNIGPRPGESRKANQLRGMVSENRGTTRVSKKEREEADRTFLTSLQYQPQATAAARLEESPYRRPLTATQRTAPVTKRDLLRARSAGVTRQSPASPPRDANVRSPARRSSPKGTHKANSSPGRKRTPSPTRRHAAVDKRTVFVPPEPCLPSKALPKELADYLFASSRESDLKISLFCQHGRHFASCKADLCVDAHEKYRWLTLIHNKAKEACALVCDADRMWRTKLEKGLEDEVEERKAELDLEVALRVSVPAYKHLHCVVLCCCLQLEALNAKLKKRSIDQTRLLKKGVAFYESTLPAMHRGDITAEELYKSTGWTAEHYENFKRRLQLERDRTDVQRKMFLDQQAHKNQEALNELRHSLR
jgi:hypothetical protein